MKDLHCQAENFRVNSRSRVIQDDEWGSDPVRTLRRAGLAGSSEWMNDRG